MKNIALCALFGISFAYADNYVQTQPAPNLSPLDKKLKQLSSQYSPNTAYYIDARTGKIISIAKTPTRAQIAHKKGAKMPMEKAPKAKIPFEMQEERIELLR